MLNERRRLKFLKEPPAEGINEKQNHSVVVAGFESVCDAVWNSRKAAGVVARFDEC